MSYHVIRYRPAFRDQVLLLQKHLWGPDLDLNDAYFAWKYERNPYLREPLIYLVLSGSKVIGMRGFFGAEWQLGASEPAHLCLCAGDLVVDPAHRGRGLFNPLRSVMQFAISDLAEQGHAYVFNLSANRINNLASLRMGWRLVAPNEERRRHGSWQARAMSRIRNHPVLQRNWDRVRQIPALQRASQLGASQSSVRKFRTLDAVSSLKTNRGVVTITRDPRPSVMADLARHVGSGQRLRHVRSEEYFAWRYQSPGQDYRFLFLGDPDPRGFLVLQAQWKTRHVSIVDWEAASAEVRDCLLESALRLGAFDSLSIWSVSLPKDMTDKLSDFGFAPVHTGQNAIDYRPGLLVKALKEDVPVDHWRIADRKILDIANWDLRMIYSDFY